MKQLSDQPIILAVDTSCDDTSASVVAGTTFHSNVIASQTQLHKQYGGVFPTVAKQAHKENILPVITAALKKAQIRFDDKKSLEDNLKSGIISALAVTIGPGLAPALEVGISTMVNLAQASGIKLIAVNHIEGHILSNLAQAKSRTSIQKSSPGISFPVLAIIVSGKHTEFILFTTIGEYQILGSTVDDAAGECLDKVGRMLGLGYPAGGVIEEFAKLGNPLAIPFPLPMTQSDNCDLSYSGLKTFARNYIEKNHSTTPLNKQQIYDFCASIQYAVFRHISHKLNKILEKIEINEIWLGGGVAQNANLKQTIRKTVRKFEQTHATAQKIKVISPTTKRLCMDNAAMIGIAAYYKYQKSDFVADLTTIDRKPRLKITEKIN